MLSSELEGMLHARDLVTEHGQPTVASWGLFADRPQAHYPEAYVRVLRYLQNERGTGRDLQLYDHGDIRLEGSIPEQVRRQADVHLGTSSIAQLVGISTVTANKYLKQLRDEGLVTWQGTSPRDPQATWQLS